MAGTEKRKQSLYFPDDMLKEIMKEAIRLDRSLSWIVQQAWRIASEELARFPSVNQPAAPLEAAHERPAAAPKPPHLPTTESEPPVSPPERQPGSQVREFISGKFENK